VPAIEKAFKKTTERSFQRIEKREKEIYYKVVESDQKKPLLLPSGEKEII